MKISRTILLTILFLTSFASHAEMDGWTTNNARLTAMQLGYSGVTDAFDIWTNPALISGYKNKVFVELGDFASAGTATANNATAAGSKFGGANIETSFGLVGIYIGRMYKDGFPGISQMDFGDPDLDGVDPDNRFDLFYGMNLSNMQVGMRVNYNSFVENFDSTVGAVTTEYSRSSREINFSLGAAMGNIDFAMIIGLPMFSSEIVPNTAAVDKTSVSSSGAWTLGLIGRGEFALSNTTSVLASANFALERYNSKLEDKTATTNEKVNGTDSITSAGVSAAFLMHPTTKNLVIAHIGLNYKLGSEIFKATTVAGTLKSTFDQSNYNIPLTIAFENSTSEKLTLRGSVQKHLVSTDSMKIKLSTPGSNTESNAKAAPLGANYATLGFGFGYQVMKGLVVDGVINQDIIFTGTYLLSGINDTLSSKVSVTYDF